MPSDMLMPNLAFALLLVGLLSTTVADQALKRRRPQGLTSAERMAGYRRQMILMWGLTIVAVVSWRMQGGTLTGLGLLLPSPTGWRAGALLLALAATLAILASGYRIWRNGMSQQEREHVAQAADFDMIAPQNARELKLYWGVAVTAGVTEEVLLRGFAIPILTQWMPLAAAVGLSILLFVIPHAYQGAKGLVRIIPVTLFLTALYLMSGSVWPGIAVHISADLLGGIVFMQCWQLPRERSAQ